MKTTRYVSPLRYPGGKQKLGSFFARAINLNKLNGCDYAEGYAGGAGVGLHLLHCGKVSSIHLNDADRSVFALWHTATKHAPKLIDFVRKVPLTKSEWDRQKDVQRRKRDAPLLDLAMSTLFLNRTNRSGILRGGMIGGRSQDGSWNLHARFNRDGLAHRLEVINALRSKITVTSLDALEFAKSFPKRTRANPVLFYFDPPYFAKSRDLYLNYYRPEDHATLARYLTRRCPHPWLLTYDDCFAVRRLYAGYRCRRFALRYTADEPRIGKEVLIASPTLRVPSRIYPPLSTIHRSKSTATRAALYQSLP